MPAGQRVTTDAICPLKSPAELTDGRVSRDKSPLRLIDSFSMFLDIAGCVTSIDNELGG